MRIYRLISCAVFLVALAVPPAVLGASPLKGEILGLRVNMPKADVQKRLQEIGKFVRDERKRQQVWEVRHESYSHVVIGFDSRDLLRYVTAVAREDKDAKRVAYSDIAKVEEAQQAGDRAINNFNYEWRITPEKGQPDAMILARGRDPKFLSTYSLKRLAEHAEEPDEKE